MPSGRVLPSLAAQQLGLRTPPPDPPPKRTRADFDTEDEFVEYKKTRRKAMERVREYNRRGTRYGRTYPAQDYARAMKRHERLVKTLAEEEKLVKNDVVVEFSAGHRGSCGPQAVPAVDVAATEASQAGGAGQGVCVLSTIEHSGK